MLSTLRVTSRQAVARESGMRALLTGVRAGSTWANVPQGPPVSLQTRQLDPKGGVVTFADDARMPFWVSPKPSRPTLSARRSTLVLVLTVC